MTLPPWAILRRLRRERGMTQAELAHGIVSQSMISHIEQGRIMPSEAVILKLADKVGMDGPFFVSEWRRWRKRSAVRRLIWKAVIDNRRSDVQTLAEQYDSVFTHYERWVYRAWVQVAEGNVLASEHALQHAWLDSLGAVESPAGAWKSQLDSSPCTQVEYWRIQAIEACTQERICLAVGRTAAAACWREKFRERTRKEEHNLVSTSTTP